MLRTVGVVVIVAGLLLLADPALAGGWAVVTLDALPAEVRAGESLALGLMVRQHGHTPNDGARPMLSARNEATGERITAEGRQSGERGHYVIDVVFPSEGQWEWSITAFGPEMPLAPLTVLPATAPPASAAAATELFPLQAVLRWTGLALLVGSGVMALAVYARRPQSGIAVAGD